MERVEVGANGFTFTGLAEGTLAGRAVLFLHGFPQTSWCWRHQLEALGAAGHRALAFDQRGYSPGARPARVEDYAIDALVGDALGVADAQGWERFDVVGHDWGAAVAWVIAARHAERVRTLTAVSVPHPAAFASALGGGDRDQRRRSSYIEVFRAPGGVAEDSLLGEDRSGEGLRRMFASSGLASSGLGDGGEDVEVYVRAMLEPGALTAALNWYRAMTAGAFAGIGPVSVPTMYVWSTKDVALGRKAAEATAGWVRGPYAFEVLEGVSHWVPETAAGELSRLLLAHLAANR